MPNSLVQQTNSRGKAKRFAWTPLSNSGRLEWHDKNLLNVDHTYQRRNICNARVLDIAGAFSWMFFGVLCVAKRPDGTYWCFDGQHRLLAARKRGDEIQDVPCWVFDVVELKDEAKAFVGTNTIRGAMASIEKFRGSLVAEDETALEVAAMLERIGYAIGTGKQWQTGCVAGITRAVQRDSESAERALALCAELYNGSSIKDQVFRAVAYLDWFLSSKHSVNLTRPDLRRKLLALGPDELHRSIHNAKQFHGKGGERVMADGVVKAINKQKSANRIPSPSP